MFSLFRRRPVALSQVSSRCEGKLSVNLGNCGRGMPQYKKHWGKVGEFYFFISAQVVVSLPVMETASILDNPSFMMD